LFHRRLLVCFSVVNGIIQKVTGGDFCDIWEIGKLCTRKELIKFAKVRITVSGNDTVAEVFALLSAV